MQPKTSFYLNNGTGRDSYISVNSGGLRVNSEPLKMCFSSKNMNKSKMLSFKIGSPQQKNLKITNTATKYFGDGTGRDSYVITNGGGTIKNPKTRMQIMKDYTDNKIEFHKNKELNKSISLKENFFGGKEIQGKNMQYIIKQPVKICHLNDIGRPRMDMHCDHCSMGCELGGKKQSGCHLRQSSEISLPMIKRSNSYIRGKPNVNGLSMDSASIEYVMSKHGSYPFLNTRSMVC